MGAEMKRGLVAGAIAAGIGLATAAPASAYTSQEDAYLAQLGNTPGVTVNGFTSILLVNAGNAVCNDLRVGISPEDAAVRQLSYPGSSIALTRIMVGAAQTNICPEAS